MDKSTIKRDAFKHNFLDKGILRVDYSGVIDVKGTVLKLSEYLHSKGFTEESETPINEISIKLPDPENIDTLRSSIVDDISKNTSYKFFDPQKKNIIEITKFFTTLTIDYSTCYCKFEEYINIFKEISNKLGSNNDFIKPIRLGERKINSIFFVDTLLIPEYFEYPYFVDLHENMSNVCDNSELIIHNAMDTFKIDDKNVNISRHISKGTLSIPNVPNQPVTRLLLDIDCYSKEGLYISDIFGNENVKYKLNELNALLFDIFINALRDKLINILISSDLDQEGKTFGIRRQ